jgi:hypothetical protein
MIKMFKYKSVYLKEVLGLLCQECNSMVVKCDNCKNIFSFSESQYKHILLKTTRGENDE